MNRRPAGLVGLAALLGVAALGCNLATLGTARFHRVDEKVGTATKHYRESRFALTDAGRFSVELLVKDALAVGPNRVLLILHDADDVDVEGARVTATLGGPAAPKAPAPVVARDDGAGRYELVGLAAARPGTAELTIRVAVGRTEDRTVFAVPVAAPEGGG